MNPTQWNSHNGKKTFRMVITDYNQNTIWDKHLLNEYISEWYLWRQMQSLDDIELLVCKFGHGNAFNDNKYIDLAEQFINNNVISTPTRIAVYHNYCSSIDSQLYDQYIQLAKRQKEHIALCVSTIVDMQSLTTYEITPLIDYLKVHHINQLHNIILFKNIHCINEHNIEYFKVLVAALMASGIVVGFDVISHISNLNIQQETHSEGLLNLVSLLHNTPEIKHSLTPEFDGIFNNASSGLKDTIFNQVCDFVADGLLYNTINNTITPLIYGAADDFGVLPSLPHTQAIVLNHEELVAKFNALAFKKILKSSCFTCQLVESCSSKRIWWLNIATTLHDNCAIKMDTHIAKL